MKFFSLLPWLQNKIPGVKGILLYGTNEKLISFRVKCLQKIYSHHHYISSLTSSMDEALKILQALPELFETTVTQKHILLNNITDSSLNKGKIIEILGSTPHIFLTQSSKLPSRSKVVCAFQDAKETAAISCYDVQENELIQVYQWFNQTNNLKLTPEALVFLMNFSLDNLDKFFSVIDLLIVYAGKETLDCDQLKNILSQFTSLPLEKFNQHFFLQELMSINNLAQTIDLSEWLGLIRILIQDLVNLMSFHIHDLKPSELKNCWSKKQVQFSYTRLGLYEKSLPLWNRQRCHETLNSLLNLECHIKSTSPPTFTQILNQLIELSRTC